MIIEKNLYLNNYINVDELNRIKIKKLCFF